LAEDYRLPLFPLASVLLPGGRTALRLFEPRYLDMVSGCLRRDSGFGICLIRSGGEAGQPALPFGVGTEVRIIDWDRQPDGLLGIVVEGQHKIRVREMEVQADNLVVATVEVLPPEPPAAVPDDCRVLVEILRQILDRVEPVIRYEHPRWDDAGWVGSRLTELLPLPPRVRQYLVELDNPLARLTELRAALK
jgi:Lon protease-like protein